MRIDRIRVGAFGRVRDLDTGPGSLPGLVVVEGPNEAGKSTLFHFLTSMLYGFHPASREGNPYTPWEHGDAAGQVTLGLEGGGCVEVERRLRSQPSARMTGPDGTEDLRNRPLPWVEHVPRTVFRQVFAVTLAELASLDGEAWDRVQDRIIGSMGASDLLPARQVAAELEREAGELWRPTRRGNQRIRDLQERLLSLRERRRVALENDRRLRSVVAEATRVRDRLAEARRSRQQTRGTLDRLQELVPVRRQLQRIAALEATAGDHASLDGLPADPSAELVACQRRVRSLRDHLVDLRDQRSTPEGTVAAFGAAERALLAHEDRIRSFVARAGALGPDRSRLAALDQEIRDLDRRMASTAQRILTPAAQQSDVEALIRIPVLDLRERVHIARTTRDERFRLETALERRATPPEPRRLWLALGSLVAGLAVLAFGLATSTTWATVAGSAVAAMSGAALARWIGGRRGQGFAESTRPAEAAAREAGARARVRELFEGLPLQPSAIDPPTDTLVAAVERVGELARDRAERGRAAEELTAAIERLNHEARELTAAVGASDSSGASAAAHVLDAALRRAERSRQAATAAEREVGRLRREEARLDGDLSREERSLAALRERLAEAGGGDVDAGARTFRTRLEARDRARQLQDELERAHPHLERIRQDVADAEAAGEAWTSEGHDLGVLRARLQDETEEVERLVAQAQALERDAAHLGGVETVDAVDGEAAALQEEVTALVRERDRRWVLAHALRQADRRFRDEHQPDLMRRASEHLAHLTDGRYTRIAADETAGRDRFQIHGAGLPRPIPLVPPVSTGTLEQTYLALRLAIVDHLDQGRERLPLFVDEVFVNWDRQRRLRGMRVLAGIAQRRQLFVFTCHPEVSADLAAQGAKVLTLDPDG